MGESMPHGQKAIDERGPEFIREPIGNAENNGKI